MIKEFARHHMKTEDVKIDEDLAHQVWERGIKHPPRKIRVRMTKTEEGSVLIAPYEEEIEEKVSKKEKPSKHKEKQAEKVTTEKPEVEAEILEAVEKEITEKPKKIAAEIVEAAEKEVKAKPKKSPEKEKPKAPAKKETPKAPTKEKPKVAAKEEKPSLASFVDPSKGAQHYIDRYNKETKYKEWFHRNYPNMTIEEAVGLEPKKEKPKTPAKEQTPKKATTKEEKPKKKSD